MSNIVVDDTDPTLTYSGQWTLVAGGSSRQWNSTVHSTFQYGATVSFGFRGSVCMVYGTVPPGNGSTILIDVTIDGSVSPIISVTSASAAVYANLFYQSSAMESNWHTVIITNRGSTGNLDFEFDRVELDANDILPSLTSFSPASTAAAASSTSTLTFPSVTTTLQDGSVATSEVTLLPTSAVQPVPVGTVIGIVGGIIALLILLLLLFFYHRRRKANHLNMSRNSTTVATVTPFSHGRSPTDLNSTHSSSRLPLFSAMSEKALLVRQQTPAYRSETDLQATPTPPDLSPSSNTSPLNEPSDPSPPTGPQGPPEPNQADAAYRLQYLSESTSRVGPSIPAYDVPPAYRANNE